jgi:hypothetical protein
MNVLLHSRLFADRLLANHSIGCPFESKVTVPLIVPVDCPRHTATPLRLKTTLKTTIRSEVWAIILLLSLL